MSDTPTPLDALPGAHAASLATAAPTAGALDGAQALGEGLAHLAGRRVLVLGLGQSGLAMVHWCVRLGCSVTVADTRAQPPGYPHLEPLGPQVTFVHTALDADLLETWQPVMVAVSPGLAPHVHGAVTDAARARGVAVLGELGLFVQALEVLRQRCAYAPQILAVTGTNGKTTVTALTAMLVERAGRSVAMAGNISPSLLEALAGALDAHTWPQVWVLELSSFQLDGMRNFEPTAATVLNLSQDHLDWHPDMAAYAAAKACVFGSQGLQILNRADPAVMAMAPPPTRTRSGRLQQRPYVSFGPDVPAREGDFGLELVHGMSWLVRAQDNHGDLLLQRLMPVDALRIRGQHNALNVLAALALATAIGCTLAPMLHALREYRGEPHRMQSVGIVDGVEFFNDSKGTNVGATVAALEGLGIHQRLAVILGGEGKGQDFAPLAEPVRRYARAVVLIGRDGPVIRQALAGTGVDLIDAASLPQAVRLAQERVRPGDAVLLSPACASFDMFNNYPHRGEVFRDAVADLAARAGTPLEGAAG